MRKLIFLLTFALLLFHSPAFVFADACISLPLGQEREDCYQKILDTLGSQANTLAGQIAFYDTQIKLVLSKITQTEGQITSISSKIESLEQKLQDRSQLLEKQIVQTYKKGGLDPFEIFFSVNNFSDLLSQVKYLQTIQASNRKFLYDTQTVQTSYAQQKKLIEESRKRLQTQKTTLANLRADRDNLLRQTKNSEAIYQKLLEQARLEYEVIQKALIAGKKEGPVKKGDPIAIVGNSGYWAPDPRLGCSTGKHLHFEVRVNDDWVNTETYLKNTTDKWGLNIGSGNWDWPIKGTIGITQRYGKTDYSYVYKYSGGIHTGIDMVSNQDVVYAVADGTLYSYTGKCGPADLNIKYIDHGSGLKTLYLHVQ
ncbi:MAG: Peptidase, M23 family [Candidatus Amesbacteria bacterium GW2011_GWA1_46_35]|uniref:Peptidase, M23 family n=1 Tax=Candidatus Amesbacteria bacterium GW2011_GWC2_45_19 TaxID=1618366 RepID=A0A0G1M5A1_9BACT|nr:MAG: Peptidase, M23 family [Candidatus Amesbacteria bacterium GW2011_GWC2_45_19]KKU38161.1 MAG: Peptidase, M23 family [Candidatus Amesbacteria bacterium GW2011_GWA1_46_35]KKU69566.1 MAG: Peptidase, M23 family [Microgenomates group bacterium GW2011_GWC1_47_20]